MGSKGKNNKIIINFWDSKTTAAAAATAEPHTYHTQIGFKKSIQPQVLLLMLLRFYLFIIVTFHFHLNWAGFLHSFLILRLFFATDLPTATTTKKTM